MKTKLENWNEIWRKIEGRFCILVFFYLICKEWTGLKGRKLDWIRPNGPNLIEQEVIYNFLGVKFYFSR